MVTRMTMLLSSLILLVFAVWLFCAPIRAGAVDGPKSGGIGIGIGGETIKIEFTGGEPAVIAAASHAGTYECTIDVFESSGKRIAISKDEKDGSKTVRARLVVWVPAKTQVYSIKISTTGGSSYKTN